MKRLRDESLHRAARLRDTYEAECVCGTHIESHEPETRCPQCRRHLVFEWGRPVVVCVDRFPEGESR